jgi:hypothetical protein
MILDIMEKCSKIDSELSTFVHNIILLIKTAVPIILVLFGMLDFAKGVIASKEDEIKKGQQTFFKRLIAATIVFFMVSFTQLIIGILDNQTNGEIWNCANLIMNGRTQNKMTKEDENEQMNIIVEQCCEYAEGTISKGTNSVSCGNPDKEKYNACYQEKTDKLKKGE